MIKELKQMKKFLSPILERNKQMEEFRSLSEKEKIKIIKKELNLTHGKGKRKRRK